MGGLLGGLVHDYRGVVGVGDVAVLLALVGVGLVKRDVVPALVKSAFNYAGQKCSAAARVLAHEAIHDGLVERLAGAIEVLHVGQASDPEIDVPPVIEREAQERYAAQQASADAAEQAAARARADAERLAAEAG